MPARRKIRWVDETNMEQRREVEASDPPLDALEGTWFRSKFDMHIWEGLGRWIKLALRYASYLVQTRR